MSTYALLFIFAVVSIASAGGVWIETTTDDFQDGIFNATLYASHAAGGTVEYVPRYDLDNDGYIDIFSSSSSAISIYWGNSQGYSLTDKISFASDGTGGCEGADLNNDGYPEFIASYGNGDARLVIYWGTPNGYTYANNFSIPTVTNEALYVADLNNDGYLDICVATSLNFSTSSIYWGSPSGYSSTNRQDLPSVYGAHNFEASDLNKDGWIDLIIVNNNASYNYIYWGSANGFSSANRTTLNLPGVSIPHGTTVADFNNDGRLDIVFTAVFSNGAYVFWGSENGYQNYQLLNPGSCYGGSSAVNFNGDTYVDIVFFRGRSGNKPVVYWGSANGFSETNRWEFGSYISGSGGFIADLNGDCALDVFVENYEGSSQIFWGPGYTSSFTIPTNGDHHAMFREVGNTYNRQYYEDYSSSIFDAGTIVDWDRAEWDAETPAGSVLAFYVRTGNTEAPDGSWSDWCQSGYGTPIPDYLNARYVQYRMRLGFSTPACLPNLQEVRIFYYGAGTIAANIRIKPETINLKSQGKFSAFITLPAGYDPGDINGLTITCEGAHAVFCEVTPGFLVAKFNVQDLTGVGTGPAVPFNVTGQLYNGTSFYGCDTVRVLDLDLIRIRCTPNPFQDRTAISLTPVSQRPVAVKVFNLLGELVRDLSIEGKRPAENRIVWDRKDNAGRTVPAGVYMLEVQDSETRVTEKVVIFK